MNEPVCRGEVGFIRKSKSSSEKVEGVKMVCPDDTEYRFPTGDRERALSQTRRVLDQKGFNADLVDNSE